MHVQMLLTVICVLLAVAFFTWFERKVLGSMHFRKGPNKVVISGFFQPLADAIKLLTKNESPVMWSNKALYYISPVVLLFLSICIWWVFPMNWTIYSSSLTFIYTICVLGTSVYSSMLSGWSSNSKYSMIGSIRAISQSISYEVILSLLFLNFMNLMCSFSLITFYNFSYTAFLLYSPLLFISFLISTLAELGRVPFDLPEGESELVSGYTIEYGGVMYMIIFLGENMNLVFSSVLVSFIFFMKFNNFFFSFITVSLVLFFICLIRGVLPRIRYDQMMLYCWIWLLPCILILFNYSFMIKFL